MNRWRGSIAFFAPVLALAMSVLGAPSGQSDDTPGARTLVVFPAPSTTEGRRHEWALLPAPEHRSADNAAPLYYQAMLMLASLSLDDQQHLQALSDASPEQFDSRYVEQLVQQLQEVFVLVDLASRRDTCDWGTPLRERGLHVRVPEAGYLRVLGMALGVKARWEVYAGKHDAALRTIAWGLRLARHTSGGPTFVQCMVGVFIADQMANQIEAFISMPGAPSLYWALVAMGDEVVSINSALRSERLMLDYEVASLADVAAGRIAPEKAMQLLEPYVYPSRGESAARYGWRKAVDAGSFYPAGRAALEAGGMSRDEISRLPVTYVAMRYHLSRYLELRDDLNRWAALPYWQAQEGLQRARLAIEAAQARGEGGALLDAIPDVGALKLNATRLNRRFAMLRVIETLRKDPAGLLPASLTELNEAPAPLDPLSGREFTYRTTTHEAEIRGPRSGPQRNDEIVYRVRIQAESAKK